MVLMATAPTLLASRNSTQIASKKSSAWWFRDSLYQFYGPAKPAMMLQAGFAYHHWKYLHPIPPAKFQCDLAGISRSLIWRYSSNILPYSSSCLQKTSVNPCSINPVSRTAWSKHNPLSPLQSPLRPIPDVFPYVFKGTIWNQHTLYDLASVQVCAQYRRVQQSSHTGVTVMFGPFWTTREAFSRFCRKAAAELTAEPNATVTPAKHKGSSHTSWQEHIPRENERRV